MAHLVLYDDSCPLCQHMVAFLLDRDIQHQLLFAPLNGQTARPYRAKIADSDTLIFIENFHQGEHLLIEGQAVLRLFWHLGGIYKLFGLFSFLPPFLFKPFYRLVAKNRHRFFKKGIFIEVPQDRFLP